MISSHIGAYSTYFICLDNPINTEYILHVSGCERSPATNSCDLFCISIQLFPDLLLIFAWLQAVSKSTNVSSFGVTPLSCIWSNISKACWKQPFCAKPPIIAVHEITFLQLHLRGVRTSELLHGFAFLGALLLHLQRLQE